jgi:ParB family chromosome partitioning protein
MDPECLDRLAASVREAGVLQPIVVRPKGDMYELVMGERRLRAARLAGLDRIPAVVREVPDDRLLEFALIENVQREDLNPIEKAQAIGQLIQELELTQEQAGERLGMDRSTVANLLRLLELPGKVRDMVSRGTLSGGHARAILALPSEPARIALGQRVVTQGLSVRETERLAASRPARRHRTPPSPEVKQLENALREALAMRVDIHSRGARGRLVIHFQTHEDFERLLERLTGLAERAEAG